MNFLSKQIIKCGDKLLDLSSPQVMGIINLSPGSFCAESYCDTVENALNRAKQMVDDGAAIIDIGAEPTNPLVNPVVSTQHEMARLMPVLARLCREIPVPISVDTSKPEIIIEAAQLGAGLINDVRALRLAGALEAAARTDLPICLMHMAYMDGLAKQAEFMHLDGPSLVNEIKQFLQARIKAAETVGIARKRLIIDPGFGGGSFGKSTNQNCYLLQHLNEFSQFGIPILAGLSRKTFIGDLLDLPQEKRVNASLAAAVLAVTKGANLIRTYDVRATVEALRITQAVMEADDGI